MTKNTFKITIVGGGPIGLFLGICLSKQGIDCTILEKRAEPVPDSRSLGIHPVSLELFRKTNIASKFLDAGIHIKKGLAHNGKRLLGSINFEQLERPYNFILACPQFETEKILREHFLALNPQGLITEALVTNIEENMDEAICYYQKDGKEISLSSTYIVGCDGKNSLVRQQSRIFYGGTKYPDTYIMGDFEDNTTIGDNAVVFLPKQGLIESFPLPNQMRRWVVKTDSLVEKPTAQLISEITLHRIDHDLKNLKNTMLSSFNVQYFEAECFFKNRVLLCGDAAHVVSPIGGQGMNLGWIGAWLLAKALSEINIYPEQETEFLLGFQNQQKNIVKKASRRAEWNMRIGRKQRFPIYRELFVTLLLNSPLNKVAAQKFAMKGLT
ncbi:MAG TPA: oxidoreductase [Balneola sp.]|jgi:2-polyprenyl-6-methoxyphenol hydroxylase-like FAD-dependent oxidoreductase|nr:oxidoreductase [Balneola sp.]HCT52548.1 oxidoreductase [Balneola sp.]|tara:strand:- start:6848 stop:7996 length:1149 start_codon:yes stop_codon:yes gene_type:complete